MIDASRIHRFARAVVGIIIFVAITAQVAHYIAAGNFHAVNFFSFFTIEANIIAAAVLMLVALRPNRHPITAMLRGAATLYMTITFIIYASILATPNDILLLWVNLV